MKYKKAQNVLPQHILKLVQEYVDGGYLYIPPKKIKIKGLGELSVV